MLGPDFRSTLGDEQFWATALGCLKKPKRAATPRVPRVGSLDPLGITILGTGPVIRPQPGAGCDYRMVGSIGELREYLRPAFEDRIAFGADWEASSLNPVKALPAGLSVSVSPKTARYVPVGHALSPEANLPLMEVVQVLQELDMLGVFSLWYNTTYDLEVMMNAVRWEPVYWHDAQIAVFLADSNVIELNLKSTALRLLGTKMQTIEELDEEWVLLSKKAQKERPHKLPHEMTAEKVTPYGCADADCTRQIFFHPQVQEAIRDQPLIWQLEEWLIPVMREGNRHGVYLDLDKLRELQVEAKQMMEELKPQIFQRLGSEPFALSKRALLGEKLLACKAIGYIETNQKSPEFGQWTAERTDKGQIATGAKVLDKYRPKRDDPPDSPRQVIPLLLQYTQLETQERNYIRKLIRAAEHFSKEDWAKGRVRFSFNSIGVPTGRMKCGGAGKAGEAFNKGVVDVNGQSLPDHEKAPYLPNTRSAIIAPPGYVIVAVDYSQIELRIAGNESKEPVWIDAYVNNKDLHVVMGQKIADVREPGVIVTAKDKKRRGGAKTTNFALLYGGDERTVARNAGIPVEEGKAILDAYFAGVPYLKGWIERSHASARVLKYCRTFMGRKRHLEAYFLPEPGRKDFRLWKQWKKLDERGCREAINHPVQGGAADIFKLACVRLRRAIKAQGWGYDIISPQIYWVHDEVVFYVKEEWVPKVIPVLRTAMEFEVKNWPIPLKAEFEVSSRILYAEGKAQKAREDGDLATAAKWDAIAQLPEHRNYGELVDADLWMERFLPQEARVA